MKAIAYSLFGYNKAKHPDCFDFPSYLRGLSINVRLCRMVYPGWTVILHTDRETHDAYQRYFELMPITVNVLPSAALTKAMLWRLKPVYEKNWSEEAQGFTDWKYTHVLCRDLDSPVTYREAQAVQYWINKDKAIHCITDSVSHNLPMLGGMIGIRPHYFTERTNTKTWDELMSLGAHIDYSNKGADQVFLNSHIYPVFSRHGHDSVTQHYLEGMPNSFLTDYHREIQPLDLPDVPFEYKCTNDCAVHIGQSGWNETPTLKIFNKYEHIFSDIIEAEKKYPLIFYWNNK